MRRLITQLACATAFTLLAPPLSPSAKANTPPGSPAPFDGGILHIEANETRNQPINLLQTAYIRIDENATATWNGPITQGPNNQDDLVILGGGTLQLNGNNQHSGFTRLLQGTLALGHEHAAGQSSINAYAGTQLHYADGLSINNPLGLSLANPENHLPFGTPLPTTTPSGYEHAIHWTVDSGQAEHTGMLYGTAPFIKQGQGSLLLSGDGMSYSGNIGVDEGQLLVNDFYLAHINVGAGARLGGLGSIASANINSGATLAPGNSLGTLTVLGDVQFEPGSTFQVQVQPNGQSSQLQIGGQAQLAGQVLALANEGNWQPNTYYTLLHADGGLQGTTFDSVNTNLAFLSPSLSYTDQEVQLQLQRNDLPLNDPADPDDKDVADAIDDDGPPEIKDELLQQSPEGARHGFRQLANRWAPSLQTRQLQHSHQLSQLALAQNTAVADHATPWASLLASRSNTSTGWHPKRTRSRNGGLAGGVLYPLKPGLQLNTYFAAENTRHRLHAQNSSTGLPGSRYQARSTTLTLGTTLSQQTRWGQWQLGASQQWSRQKARRTLHLGKLHNTLHQRSHQHLSQLLGQALINTPLPGLNALAGLSWLHLRSPANTETGGPAALHLHKSRQNLGIATVGLRWQHKLGSSSTSPILWHGSLALDHAFGQRTPKSRQHFAHNSKKRSFTVHGTRYPKWLLKLETGISAQASKRLQLGLDVGVEKAKGLNSLNAGVRLGWRY